MLLEPLRPCDPTTRMLGAPKVSAAAHVGLAKRAEIKPRSLPAAVTIKTELEERATPAMSNPYFLEMNWIWISCSVVNGEVMVGRAALVWRYQL